MKLSLIGMSGIGKTYWSQKLEQKGFIRFCCDDLIEKKLTKELTDLGYQGIQDVAKWMGQPFDERYMKASDKYITFEREVMVELLSDIEKISQNENIVIDTTGSVIYIDQVTLKKFAQVTKVIYLQTSPEAQQEMFALYCKDPKPVFWGESFYKKRGETNQEALRRCYSKLLTWRAKQYEKLAHSTLSDYQLRNDVFAINLFHDALKVYDFV